MSSVQRTPRFEREWIQRSQPVRHAESHVAAVCYRFRDGEIEFLLVKTRAGRWTFPKGRVEADPTRAAAAAREAYEEAGVYGRVEMVPFSSYVHSKGSRFRHLRDEHMVDAHLCEVLELETPEESYRDPTWFSIQKSKRRLHQDRSPRYGLELARIVDHAVERISHRHRKHLHR